MRALANFARQIFAPAPPPQAAAARARAAEVVEKAQEYGRQADVLADLVRAARGVPHTSRKRRDSGQ